MNWRWLLWDFADPALPLTRRTRMLASWCPVPWKDLPTKARLARIFYVCGVALLGLMAFFFWLWLLGVGGAIPGRALLLWIGSMFLLIWVGGSIAYGLLCRYEQFYRIRLEGYEVCIRCGYWLRGLADDATRCPECGADREPMPEAKR